MNSCCKELFEALSRIVKEIEESDEGQSFTLSVGAIEDAKRAIEEAGRNS